MAHSSHLRHFRYDRINWIVRSRLVLSFVWSEVLVLCLVCVFSHVVGDGLYEGLDWLGQVLK
jgi:hypothetical protein